QIDIAHTCLPCRTMKRLCTIPLLVFLLAGKLPAAEPVDYLRDVKPILVKHCVSCHGAEEQRAGLRLCTAKAAREGGNSGSAIRVGKSQDSLLILARTGSEKVKAMPPKEKPRAPAEHIPILRAWMDAGAKHPAPKTAEGTGAKSSHWAFQP